MIEHQRLTSTRRQQSSFRPRPLVAMGLGGVCATVALVVLAGVGPAFANGGVAMAVDVRNSRQTMTDSSSGSCTWEVASDVTVVNMLSQPVTINDVSYSVSWTASGNRSGVQNQVTAVNDGGLRSGVTLAANERRTFSPVVLDFVIPCGADFGDLSVRISSADGTGSGDAPFLSGGTPVPPAAVGALALAAVIGGSLILRRRRRPERVLSSF